MSALAKGVARVLSEATPEAPQGGVGITTVIKHHFRDGVPFLAPIPPALTPGETRAKQNALAIGCKMDNQFTAVVEPKQTKTNPNATPLRLCRSNPRHARILSVFAALKQRGILPVRAQFAVALPHLGIATQLDGIGYDKNGTVWVIENKITTYNKRRHAGRFHAPCRRLLHLKKTPTRMINSEYNGYVIQVSAMILALRRRLPPGTPVRGIIVMAASDGAITYEVGPERATDLWFNGIRINLADRAPRRVTFSKLPTSIESREYILAKVATLGYTSIDDKLRGGSFVAKRGTSYIVVVLVHVKKDEDTISRHKHAQLELDIIAVWNKKKKAVAVKGCFFCYTGKGYGAVVDRVEYSDQNCPCRGAAKPPPATKRRGKAKR